LAVSPSPRRISSLIAAARTTEGRTVLITGGSRGLGLVLARKFAEARARVAICGRDAATLIRARDDLERRGARTLAVACDVTVREEVEALVQEVRDRLGPIDVLVNNAGIITVGPMETMTVDDFEQAMATNFWGPSMRSSRCSLTCSDAGRGGSRTSRP
jgi:NAD(P)-dependent dehydrogenase (short-subunit alcohol dehydrogenase family)